MKKILAAVLCCCFLLSAATLPAYSYGTQNYEDFSEYKSKYRILYGILLVVGGGFLAYDGLRTVKVDISRPSTNITLQSRWNETNKPGDIFLQAKGTITNTGNVTLNNIIFEVRYQSTNPSYYYPRQYVGGGETGYPVSLGSGGAGEPFPSLGINNTSSWSVQNDSTFGEAGGNPPRGTAGTPGVNNGADNWFPTATDPYTYAEVVNLKYTWDKKYKTKMNNAFEGVAGILLFGAGAYLLIDYIASLNKFEYYMKKHSMDVYVQNSSDEFQLMFSKRL